MNPQTYIFIGNSGCGKGTQAKFLEEYLKKQDAARNVFYLETGPLVRSFVKGDTYTAKVCNDIANAKERQPDCIAIWLVTGALIENIKGDEHIIADGLARSLPEAESFDTALTMYKRKANAIYLKVSEDWSRKHLLARARPDDTREGIETRLSWFKSDVMPAVEYYRNNPNYNFIEVNGEQGKEQVFEDILKKLIFF